MSATQSETTVQPETHLEIALPPQTESLEQNEEWCVVRQNNEWKKINMHDYETIYSIPGLYEQLIYEVLKCKSPQTVRALLQEELAAAGEKISDLNVLDLGAGNGMVAEELLDMGAGSVVGVDIIQAAETAARRDRPEAYSRYHVMDMTDSTAIKKKGMSEYGLNGLVCVAALGFGDIPPMAFLNSFKLVAPQGWVAFNIKAEFLNQADDSGFSRLIRLLEASGSLKVRAKRMYQHRLGTDGQPITYVAMVGRKMSDLPEGAFTDG